MKIYSKLLSKIRNNKARVKKVMGIVSVAVGLRYGKINSIPTNLSSNSTQQIEIEKVQNFVEKDRQEVNIDGKVIKTDRKSTRLNSSHLKKFSISPKKILHLT